MKIRLIIQDGLASQNKVYDISALPPLPRIGESVQAAIPATNPVQNHEVFRVVHIPDVGNDPEANYIIMVEVKPVDY